MSNKFLDIEGVKKLWEKTKEYVEQNSSSPSHTPSNELKTFRIELTKGSEWIRVAKIKDIYKNSNCMLNISCYGVKDGERKLFTSSTFSVNCAMKKSNEIDADVICLNNAIELKGGNGAGSDSGSYMNEGVELAEETIIEVVNDEGVEVTSDSGGMSSDVGSGGGSGAGAVYGLLTLAIEEYDEQRFICALVNYPATQFYQYLEVEISINDNFNFEYLEQLETVDLSIVNVQESQLLEGYEFKANERYTLCLSGNLKTFVDCVTATPPKSIYIPMDYETDEDDGDGNFITKRTTLLKYSGSTVNDVNKTQELIITSNDLTKNDADINYGADIFGYMWSEILSGSASIYCNASAYDNSICDVSKSITGYTFDLTGYNVSGYMNVKGKFNRNDFTLIFGGKNYGNNAEIPVILNGEVIMYLVNEEIRTITIPHFNADTDELIVDGTESIYVGCTCSVPIEEITYTFEMNWSSNRNARLIQYNLSADDTEAFNFNLTLQEEKRHKTEKFDVYSLYNTIEDIMFELNSKASNNELYSMFSNFSHLILHRSFPEEDDEAIMNALLKELSWRFPLDDNHSDTCVALIADSMQQNCFICSVSEQYNGTNFYYIFKAFNPMTKKIYHYDGRDQVEGEPIVFTVEDFGGNVKPEDVLQIVEENSEEVIELDVATSETYDVENDNQVPTTKAVAKIVNDAIETAIASALEAEY